MSGGAQWLIDLDGAAKAPTVDGLVRVHGYRCEGQPPEEVAMIEKAAAYGANAVFFEAGRNGRPPVAQAFVFVSDGPADDPEFAKLHRRLWSWGGVPLLYRKTPGLVQLFRCAHKPEFISATGDTICNPFRKFKIAKQLEIAGVISKGLPTEPWWDASRLRNGTLWDDPAVCTTMLSARKAAHKSLIDAVEDLNTSLNDAGILKKHLRRRLLILSLLIAYLEERGVFRPGYFGRFLKGATKFLEVLANGDALVALLRALEKRFNGHVFVLDEADAESLRGSKQLARFARLVEAREEKSGQLNLWQLYSFRDLPVELISHVYQLFVDGNNAAVYTPPFLVRLMLDEALSWKRLDRLQEKDEIILDPSCGSGVFLVEAYKRLVLHWRSRNGWQEPSVTILKGLLRRVHGVDLEPGAVELTAFSLCLALCDALEPEEIRASVKLFPPLKGETLHHACFFKAKKEGLVKGAVGIVVGNPPFQSSLNTEEAKNSYERYQKTHGPLPDKQVAYLFLHEAMGMIAKGGVLSMLQQYNFLYNQNSLGLRRDFIETWDVREILDFISVRGLFHKDTKVVVIVAEAASPPADRKILHATFRRSGRAEANQGFDIDYYDLHWLPRTLALSNDGVWRSNLLGGGRVLGFGDRLKEFRTLGSYAKTREWDHGEGFIAGATGNLVTAEHITGKELLPSRALTNAGIDRDQITTADARRFKSAYTSSRYTPPMLLIKEHMDLPLDVWEDHYLTYKAQIVGLCAPVQDTDCVRGLGSWLRRVKRPLQAYVATISACLFSRKATAICADEILALPYPETGDLDLSPNEEILVDDIVDYYRDFVRLGEGSAAMKESGDAALADFTSVFKRQINAIYKKKPLRALKPQTWPGVICQPFMFGKGEVDWSGADELGDKLDALLHEQKSPSLRVTRIARIYDGRLTFFLVKPDRLRYWMRSVALRDADETLADLRAQGF
ncbi:MAG: N-6 DNA methylase [bacterium]|nr:N-6 DNA methylase [bacterium]